MTVRISKPEFNLREKLTELDYDRVPYEKMPAGAIIQVVDHKADNSPTTTVRVLKNRWTGETGVACKLGYDKHTARMNELTLTDEDAIDDITFNEKDELNEPSI